MIGLVKIIGVWGLGRWLRISEPAILVEDPALIPSTFMTAHNHLSVNPVSGTHALFWFCGQQACVQSHTCRQNSLIYKIKKKFRIMICV